MQLPWGLQLILQRVLELRWPFRIVPNHGKGARPLHSCTDLSLDRAALGPWCKLGQGTLPSLKAVPGEELGYEPSAATAPDSGGMNVSVLKGKSR